MCGRRTPGTPVHTTAHILIASAIGTHLYPILSILLSILLGTPLRAATLVREH